MTRRVRGGWPQFRSVPAASRAGATALLTAGAFACTLSARADERPPVGHGSNALPGVDAVGVLSDMRAKVAASATVGYGLTESVIGADDVHHRVGTLLGASFAPLPWIGLAARVDGRYDAHSGAGEDGEAGFVAQSQLRVRSLFALAAPFRVGGEFALRFPGASDLERGLSSTSAELQALATFAPRDAALWLSALVGFRLDRASHGVADPSRLSLSDRVALGASDSHALLFGLALSHAIGAFDLLGEWSWDVHVGDSAPEPLQSPMRVSAGARYFPARSLHVQLLAGVSPSQRPEVEIAGPLYAIEPRFWVTAALGLYFAAAPRAPAHAPPPRATPLPTVGALRGRVVDAAGGAPLAQISVEIAGRAPVLTDAQGGFAFPGLPPGALQLRTSAPGFREATATATVVAGRDTPLDLAIERALPEGQIRGSVRGPNGKALPARIEVEPLGTVVEADAGGNFELDVAPGEYRIVISAPGHRTQQRPALVEHNGVTVILVELSRAK
jgi:hypothetical protein